MSRPTNRPITPDDFAPVSPPGAAPVQSAAFSGDGRRIAYLHRHGGQDLLALSVFDRDTGRSTLRLAADALPPVAMSLDEELARERARQRFSGITHARWLPGTGLLWSIASNRLVLVGEPDAAGGTPCIADVLVHERFIEAATAAALPGGGHAVTFSAGGDLWRVEVPAATPPAAPRFGSPRRLTGDGSDTVLNGIPDAMTREEVFNGAAFTAAGASGLAWARFDAGGVEAVTVGNGAQTRAEVARYARPGHAVALFSIESIDLPTGARRTLLVADAEWPYFRGLADWGSDALLLTRLSRDQTRLQLLKLNLDAGSGSGTAPVTELLTLTQRPWINAVAPPLRRPDGSFFLVHENAGVGRIGLYDAQGRWQRDVGADVGHVDGLVGLDADREGVLFGATGADAREHHLFHASPAGDWATVQLTTAPGVHGASLAPDARSWLRTHEALDVLPCATLETLAGEAEHRFELAGATAPSPGVPAWVAGVRPPRFFDAMAADGTTPLHAAVYEPDAAQPGLRPVVLLVYGGPHMQAVRNAWSLTVDMRAQYLAQRGFYVVKVDNRGAAGRGIVFEQPLYGRLGHVEVDDQCAALEQVLAQLPRADRSRIAVCGWSYGGYMTLRCLQRRPDLFRAGAAGAPVVNWEDYDAPYTERYMGTPVALPTFEAVNAEGYQAASVTRGEGRVAAPLLLIHGVNDENVLLRHSAALMEDLAARRVPYELLLLPGERHGVRAPVQRAYLEVRIAEFLERVLA